MLGSTGCVVSLAETPLLHGNASADELVESRKLVFGTLRSSQGKPHAPSLRLATNLQEHSALKDKNL